MRKAANACGIDAFQALALALEGIHYSLNRSGIVFRYITEEPGDTGFARYVDSPFGLKLKRRLEKMVEREIIRYSNELVRKKKRALKRKRTGRSR